MTALAQTDGRARFEETTQRSVPPGVRIDVSDLYRRIRVLNRGELTGRHRERHAVDERQLAAVADSDPPVQVVDVDADATRHRGLGRSLDQCMSGGLRKCGHGHSSEKARSVVLEE